MSYALIDTTDLTALGDAIRAKTGESGNLTISEMATAVGNISGGQTVETLPSNFLNITGDFSYGLNSDYYYGKKMRPYLFQMTFTDITNLSRAFSGISIYGVDGNINWQDWSSITINFADGTGSLSYNGHYDGSYAFQNCGYLKYLPKLRFSNTGFYITQGIFNNCYELLSVTDFMNNVIIDAVAQNNFSATFQNCNKIEEIPHLEKFVQSTITTPSRSIFYNGFNGCCNLKETLNLPTTGKFTANAFNNTFNNCYSLGRVTFETENGNPKIANWKSITIDLQYVGYVSSASYTRYMLPGKNEVNDSATYEQYKNTNYYTTLQAYSRYNHDSAVETINSLPDTSATGTNTIKFNGTSGSATDGGAISNLTAEEIAVATNKGWTVTIV